MKLKYLLIFTLMLLGTMTQARPLEKAASSKSDQPPALEQTTSLIEDTEPHSDSQLQRVQGDWLCRDTFHFENDEMKIDVVIFGYENIQSNLWRGQSLHDITVSLLVDKQWVTGQARVIERDKSTIQKITDTMFYEQLTDLDEEEWVSYDDNIAGKYIREVLFADADELARKHMKNKTLRQYRIVDWDENTLQYTTVDFSPPTHTICHRLKLIP